MGELMPYEQELIPNYNEVISEIDKTLANKEIIEDVAIKTKRDEQAAHDKKTSSDLSDPFSKYKEHEREQRRERRHKNLEKERELKYKKKVEEWMVREANRDKEK